MTDWPDLSTYQPNQLARVVQTLDSAIHQINHYLVDKYWKNQLHNPLDRDLSSVDSAIHLLRNWDLNS